MTASDMELRMADDLTVYQNKVEKVILIGIGPLDECYVSLIGERRKENVFGEPTANRIL